jgi:16S rRNA (cytidine1402-2'-O)-methyltransferase
MNSKTGTLYIVATPIGNLGDMTSRGIEVLTNADLVIAEDTRHAGILLNHFAIRVTTWSCHEHNERKQLPAIMARLQQGQAVALVSDAGTPLISDPGYSVVNEARSRGINVVPVPGCCALITALCASGLPTDRFCFEGFIPHKPGPRATFLAKLGTETRTIILYESCHRIVDSLQAICSEMGHNRKIVIARELTKKFEQYYSGSAGDICQQIMQSENNRKGEFVIMINGAEEPGADQGEAIRVLELLMAELPLKSASRIAAKWLGQNRNDLYQLGLELKAGTPTQQ